MNGRETITVAELEGRITALMVQRDRMRKDMTAIMIVYGNEAVWRACKRLGIPQSVYQKLMASDDWKATQKAEAVEKVKQIKERKTK